MRRVLFMFLVGIAHFSFCQETGYDPGYVVTSSGDTVKGYVKNKNAFRILADIRFKTTPDANVQTLSPSDIKSFKTLNDIYVSKAVDLGYGTTETYFLEKKINGFLTYYELEVSDLGTSKHGGNKSQYGILERKDAKELIAWPRSGISDFKGEILKYLKDEPVICAKIKKGTYKRKDIAMIVKEYNELRSKNYSKIN